MFEAMSGTLLSAEERARVDDLRRPDHEVILGVWDLLLTSPEADIAETVDTALAGYLDHPTPYLALFGLDPGEEYAAWLGHRMPGAWSNSGPTTVTIRTSSIPTGSSLVSPSSGVSDPVQGRRRTRPWR